MKTFLACVLLGSCAVTIAEEIHPRFIFPSFAKVDVATALTRPIAEYFPGEGPLPENEPIVVTIKNLRRIMTIGESAEQFAAAKKLLERGDQKTILRLVYSFKQGNVAVQSVWGSFGSLALIPYLMEDVASGGLEYYGSYSFGDWSTRDGRVREAAVELVASTLAHAPEFTGETLECLKTIARGGHADQIGGLSDQSRYLVQWWLLNERAFEAGKWEDTRPLPEAITYPDPGKDTFFPRDERWDPKKQPPYGSPLWEVPESFEAWAVRIVDPKRRNLDFVALSWDGTKVIGHPAKSLDPKARQDGRDSLKTPAPRNLPQPQPGDGAAGRKEMAWITAIAVLMLVLSIVRWMRRQPA